MSRRLRVDITWAAILRVLAAVILVWLWLRLWQWVLLFVVAVFLAVGLDPVVRWLDGRGIRRRYAAPLVVFAIAGVLSVFVYVAGASLVEQGRVLGERIGEFREEMTRRIPAGVLEMLPAGGGSGSQGGGSGSQSGGYAAQLGRSLVNALLSIAVAMVLTIYLLLDGGRTFEWLVTFFPRDQRPRIRDTAREGRQSVLAYVRGNITTSVIATIVTYIVLTLLKVPAALLLALLAGLFDFIPVLGVVLTAIPAVLLALTVSPTAALAVAVFIFVYNAVENYYIAPKVYGRQLRLSDLAVIAAFAVGAELAGVVGALIALPLAAMYPAVERIWLADRLGHDVVRDHRRIEGSDEH